MRTDPQVDVGASDPNQLRHAESRLHREREQGVIASAGPRGPIRRGEERLDLRIREERDEASLEAFRRNRQDALDHRGVLRMAQCGVAE